MTLTFAHGHKSHKKAIQSLCCLCVLKWHGVSKVASTTGDMNFGAKELHKTVYWCLFVCKFNIS